MSIWGTLRAQMPDLRAKMPVRGNLSGRAARAGVWSMGELGASYVLRLGSNLVMTRILLPEAFGLMAMVTTVHMALAMLSDLGISQSIVRSEQGEDTRYLRVAWTIQILRNGAIAAAVLVVATLLWLLAPGFAPPGTVYADPDLPGLIAVSSVVMVMAGLESTNQHVASRKMQLKWITIQNIAAQSVSLVAMVAIAQIDASVWSLLWGMIVGAAFRMVMSHLIFPGPRMGLAWDRAMADEFWHFGKWVIGSSLMTFIAANADRIFLGALLDKEHFGFYVIAIMWAQAGVAVSHRIATQIGLPLLSDVTRTRPHDLLRVYHRFTNMIGSLSVLGFVVLFLGGAALIRLLYPDSYAQSASFMPFLALAMLREWFTPLFILLVSQGDSKSGAISSAIDAVVTCLALPLGFAVMGIEGALLAVSLSPLAGSVMLLFIARRTVGLRVRDSLIILGAILAVAAAVGILLNPQA